MKIKLRESFEFLGVIGVIASLIFVGLQLKLSQDMALAGQYQARADNVLDLSLTQLESTGVSSGISSLLPRENELNEEERRALTIQISWLLSVYDNNHFQYENGFLDEESWVGMTNRLRIAFGSETFREQYQSSRAFYRESYVSWVDSLILEIED